MTREEEIGNAVKEFREKRKTAIGRAKHGGWYFANIFEEGIKWADEHPKSQNKVHFYVARDKNGELVLWLGKPCRCVYYWSFNSRYNIVMASNKELSLYGLDIKDYDNLKWEDEPVEVFLNLED